MVDFSNLSAQNESTVPYIMKVIISIPLCYCLYLLKIKIIVQFHKNSYLNTVEIGF